MRTLILIGLTLFSLNPLAQELTSTPTRCVELISTARLLEDNEVRTIQKFAARILLQLSNSFVHGQANYRSFLEDGLLHLQFTYEDGLSFVVLVNLDAKIIIGYSAANDSKNGVTRFELKDPISL